LTKTITETLNAGIGDFSQKLAESIVLGKELSDVFRSIAQNLLVSILKQAIELIARETLNYFWKQLQTAELFKQLALEKQITGEKIAQASVSSSSSGDGFFGSLLKIGSSFFGGSPADVPYGAEGGAMSAGQPYMVGERGRELFIPKTDGNLIPNQDLGGGTNITFNIQANDVRGIRELLIDNRATIINLVNQGANAKGKSNIV
jgi:hypothetical protein